MMICGGCHYDKRTDAYSGKRLDTIPWYVGTIYSANLTKSNSEVQNYSKTEYRNLILQGVDNEGNHIAFMGSPHIREGDLEKLLNYFFSDDYLLRSVPVEPYQTKFTLAAKLALWWQRRSGRRHDLGSAFATEAPAAMAEDGQYLVTLLECYVCHSGSLYGINRQFPEKSKNYLRGGTNFGLYKGDSVTSTDLTVLSSSGWSVAQFGAALREGITRDGSRLRPPMPTYSNLSDSEVENLYEYLSSLESR